MSIDVTGLALRVDQRMPCTAHASSREDAAAVWRHWLKWAADANGDQQFLLTQIARRGPWKYCANSLLVVGPASERTRIGLVLDDAEFDSEKDQSYIRLQIGAQSVIPAKRGKKT